MNISGPGLFASAATLRAVERARALVVLVGSYDGSGNYGDVAQLAAALELVERLGPGVLALPVLEREYLRGHRELAADSGLDPSLPLFFDPEGKLEDDLLRVAAPSELVFAATYLYGGGYFNRLWGKRKLGMLGAADALLAAGGLERPYRLASGLQVEPEWIAGLSDEDGAALRDCDPLGARDPGSRRALEALSPSGKVVESGDDAIGLLPGPPADGRGPADADLLQVNVHFAQHSWVSETPTALPGFYAGLLAELGRRAGLPVLAHPLIAYEDGRVDERSAFAHLRDACATAGVELAELRLLRPAGLAAATPSLRRASLTVSCSYHVALTSLMLEVPALLVADNPYYEQKAAGLRESFGLPPAFAPASSADPAGVAAEIAAVLLDPECAKPLVRGLAAAASRSRRRRAAADAELLARLGAAATAALNERLEAQAERLRERSAEPAELRARLAERQTELEELRWRAGDGPLEAELRAQQAEASAREAHTTLATILGSRSWRLMAPLRRLGALLRRR